MVWEGVVFCDYGRFFSSSWVLLSGVALCRSVKDS